MKNRILSFVIGIVVTLAIAGVAHYYLRHEKYKTSSEQQGAFLDALEALDLRFSDMKYKTIKNRPPNEDTVLIAVDNASIREVGRWPWGRDLMAQITQRLVDYGVKGVGMDVIWSEPERGFPENDKKLANVVKANADRIVLGTFSDNELSYKPYQDYCVTEAFLYSGGGDIAKLNATVVIDDEGEEFDNLKWGDYFVPVFKSIQENKEAETLRGLNKPGVDELSSFQKNYLQAEKEKSLFEFCSTWLTPEEHLPPRVDLDAVKELLHTVLNDNKGLAALPVDQQIDEFKKSVVDFPLPQFGEWQANIPEVQQPAQYTGSFIAYLDNDGFVRRYPLFYRSGNRLGTSFIPSLALQTYLISKGYRAEVQIEKSHGQKRIASFKIMDPSQDPERVVSELPVDAQGRMLVNYYGPQNSLYSVSAKDLLSDDKQILVSKFDSYNEFGQVRTSSVPVDRAAFFKGKSAILGVTSIAVYDLRNTPVEKNFPGPEIHLTMLANLLENSFLKKVPQEEVLLPSLILALGLLLTLILTWVGPLSTIACMSVVLIGLFYMDRMVFTHFHYVISSVFVFFEVLAVHFAMLFYKYFSEEKKRGELKRTFSKYVSPAVVDELLKNKENLKLGGRKEEMSVFFSDVRGFTQFSEKMDPQDLSQFLSEYLTPMTDIIFRNKGTLDKYMGDGVMAFFGAPVPFKDHAYHACMCALESIEALKGIQAEFDKRQWPKVDIGIGINTGFMSVGNMGSKIVQSYTVIGDAVNLGSRLEGATKEYGARIIISETTYEAVKGQFIMREVDLVRVKGKKKPIRAYQLLDVLGGGTDLNWVDLYHQAYRLYHARDFIQAEQAFAHIETVYPYDALSKIYKERCMEFMASPPPSDWDGVFEMRTK